MSDFHLSARSKNKLDGVHPDLVDVVLMAIGLTTVDFAVIEGLRTPERQQQLVKSGASKTLHSKHLTGHAVDLGAYVDGQIRWDWPLYYQIAEAMRQAAQSLDVNITWGGAWDRVLNQTDQPIDKVVAEYMNRRHFMHKPAFIDGPHFQLSEE